MHILLTRFEAIREQAQLSVVEFTDLMPFHRTTYYGWLRGREPDALRLRLAAARLDVLERLTREGSLPLGAEVQKKHRMLCIRALLQKPKTSKY